jgi:bifunctional DNA-binding transcriptional regulator/antitoxin component of YhaV-PrlF toxin-antitoxin module
MKRIIYRIREYVHGICMKLQGTVELGTNNRMTLPTKAVKTMGLEPGAVLLVYEDKGSLVLKRAPDEE